MEQTKRKTMKRIAAGVFFLALLAAFVLRASYVLIPPRLEYGAVWNMYLREPENSDDILFFGSSMAYCDVVPAVIYEETGLTSFVAAGPRQTYTLTYYAVREALKTQRPSVVFLEVTGMLFDRYTDSTTSNVAYMPYFSLNRLGATIYGAEPEKRFGFLFPLYNYHDRFDDPTVLFRPRADEKVDPLAGFTFLTTVTPQSGRTERKVDVSEEDFQQNVEYLHRIQDLCAREGIRLILFQVPSCNYIPETWMARIREAAGPDAEILDLNASFDDVGLSMDTDFYDGFQCNALGAEKVSRTLSAYLTEHCAIRPRAADPALWAWRAEEFAGRLAELRRAAGLDSAGEHQV